MCDVPRDAIDTMNRLYTVTSLHTHRPVDVTWLQPTFSCPYMDWNSWLVAIYGHWTEWPSQQAVYDNWECRSTAEQL